MKIFISLTLLSFIVLSATAAPLYYEGFMYPANQSLDGKTNAAWAGGTAAWQVPEASITISEDGLSYSNMITSGKSATLATAAIAWNQADRVIALSKSTGESLWFAYLRRQNGDYKNGLQLHLLSGNTTVVWAGKYGFQTYNTIEGSTRSDFGTVTAGNIELLVCKVDVSSSGTFVYAWINPPTDTAPSTATADAVCTARSGINNLTGIRLRYIQYSGSTTMDELRIGDTFDDAVPILTTAPPAPDGVDASKGIYMTLVNVSWTPVLTAEKYRIYRNATSDTGSASLVATDITDPYYADTTAPAGITNYYWVQAGNLFGWSDFSISDTGWRGSGSAVDIAGLVEDPNGTYGAGTDYNLYGSTIFGSSAGTVSGDIFFNMYSLTAASSPTIPTVLGGTLSGTGDLLIDSSATTTLSRIEGSTPNTLSGTFQVNGGTLILAKDPGTTAIPGQVLLNGTTRGAVLELKNSNQVADDSGVTVNGTIGGVLRTGGTTETVGTLTVQGHALIDMGAGSGALHVAASSGNAWNPASTLVIEKRSDTNRIYFGTDATGLSAAQIDNTRLKDPAGMPAGFYSVSIASDGEVIPDAVIPPAFDESQAACDARQAAYDTHGREVLSGSGTPLQANMAISCFGDSITWLDNPNSYINSLKAALAAGAGTSSKNITVNRRGINGGTAADILNGRGTDQASLQDVLDADQPDIVTMFIGINDIWWAGTSAAAYEQTMRDIATVIKTNGIQYFVMATPWLRNELPDNSNINDAKIIQFAEICSNVAADVQSADFNVAFVDLHTLGMWYLQNNNNDKFINFMPDWKKSGILTYDGVHPNSIGADFLADQLSYGIVRTLGIPEPAGLTALGFAGILGLRQLFHNNRK